MNPHPEFIIDDCIGEIKNQRYLDYEQGAKEERERIIARTEVKMARVYGKDLNTGKRALLRYELKPDDWQALKEEGDGERVK